MADTRRAAWERARVCRAPRKGDSPIAPDCDRPEGCIFSIGHSNHSAEVLLGLLEMHGIEAVADVRSRPYCAYSTQFNKDRLMASVVGAGLKYIFLGKELGGQPEGAAFYDAGGRVVYARVAQSPVFVEALDRLKKGMRQYRVAVLCSEEDPAACHRRLLIGRALAEQGIALAHIRGDGRVQTEDELAHEETGGQGDLFANAGETPPWRRSTRSVSRARTQPSSSER